MHALSLKIMYTVGIFVSPLTEKQEGEETNGFITKITSIAPMFKVPFGAFLCRSLQNCDSRLN